MIIITKVESNRVAKYLPVTDVKNADKLLSDIKSKHRDAFIYDGEYLPSLYVEGVSVTDSPVKETPEQIVARLESAVDRYLDTQAQSLRYDSIKTIVTYRDDENPKFKAEGVAGYKFRSVVYTKSIEIMNDVIAGNRPVPTETELLAEMPAITDYLVY